MPFGTTVGKFWKSFSILPQGEAVLLGLQLKSPTIVNGPVSSSAVKATILPKQSNMAVDSIR